MAIQAQLYQNNIGFPLYGSHDVMIENNCGNGFLAQSCFNSQQRHQQQQLEQRLRELYYERQRNQNMFIDNGICSNSNNPSVPNSQSLAVEFENQRLEIDQYITLQNEKLRIMLQEQRKQQAVTLLKKAETETVYLLRQKDEELEKAEKKKVELEIFLRKLEAENQAWQRLAQENEAMVLSLYNTLEQMKERACYSFNNGGSAEDAHSCCDESREMEEVERREENRNVGGAEEHISRKMMLCKGCNSRRSCFLFLPCRHLCSCKACEGFLEACPVCTAPKKASIETLI